VTDRDEKRRHLRVKAALPVQMVDQQGNVLGTCETVNLGRRGMLIRKPSTPALEKGDDVYVAIDLPTEHSRWEERDSVQHYCFHAVVTRVGEETVALHLKYAQFIFTIASDE